MLTELSSASPVADHGAVTRSSCCHWHAQPLGVVSSGVWGLGPMFWIFFFCFARFFAPARSSGLGAGESFLAVEGSLCRLLVVSLVLLASMMYAFYL